LDAIVVAPDPTAAGSSDFPADPEQSSPAARLVIEWRTAGNALTIVFRIRGTDDAEVGA
jgi:hypothetical protein